MQGEFTEKRKALLRRELWLVPIFCLLSAVHANAQTLLSGQVLYVSGKPAPYVKLEVIKDKGESIPTISDSSGFFSVNVSSAGWYILKAKDYHKKVFVPHQGTRTKIYISK